MPKMRLLLCFVGTLLFGLSFSVRAQLERSMNQPIGPGGAPINTDTSSAKSNNEYWKNEQIKISLSRPFSMLSVQIDTTIRHLHRRQILPTWYINLGNSGSPAINLGYTPYANNGPTLGYHGYDVMRFDIDSLWYYNTTRPYSLFHYELGSKQEQLASIVHSQNITPDWNFVAQYRKITSPGFYKIQRNNHDNGSFASSYQSKRQHYNAYAAFVYNKHQHDENGGLISDTFLTNSAYADRTIIPVHFQNDSYSTLRSSVTNVLRDYALQWKHSYTLGKPDTTYNEDSTKMFYRLIPKFRIAHNLRVQSEIYKYEDRAADSLRYTPLFTAFFFNNDSVKMKQRHWFIDNDFSLGGFVGKANKQANFTAGVGFRYDKFETFDTATVVDKIISAGTYLFGTLSKDALTPTSWSYNAHARFFVTGMWTGDTWLRAQLSKSLPKWGRAAVLFEQHLNSAPYNYRMVQLRQYKDGLANAGKESITKIEAGMEMPQLGLLASFRNYTIANHFYISPQQRLAQYAPAFNVLQATLSYRLQIKMIVFENELLWQNATANAPINIPALITRHQLGIETKVFKNALAISTGIEAGYHTPYKPSGYSPYLHRFYYQSTVAVANTPYLAAFFNFKVKKRFRCYVMGDQLQQLFTQNITHIPGYPMQNTMLRFGFSWMMIN